MDQSLAIYDSSAVDGYVVTADCIGRHIDLLSHMTPEKRRHVVGLQPARADIIVSGLVIAQSFLIRYGLSEISISEGDLLEGIFRRNLFI
jgi:exopolyphosphatase/guanosine-5'-triphosphate,3'-diphosphate pyrophosphatase